MDQRQMSDMKFVVPKNTVNLGDTEGTMKRGVRGWIWGYSKHP